MDAVDHAVADHVIAVCLQTGCIGFTLISKRVVLRADEQGTWLVRKARSEERGEIGVRPVRRAIQVQADVAFDILAGEQVVFAVVRDRWEDALRAVVVVGERVEEDLGPWLKSPLSRAMSDTTQARFPPAESPMSTMWSGSTSGIRVPAKSCRATS